MLPPLAPAPLPWQTQRMTRNPYVIGLLSMAGHLFVVAFMLELVIAELTDYTAYDLATVATVQAWMLVLVILAGTAIIGAAVVAGITWSHRHRGTLTPTDDADSATRVPASVA